LLQAAVVVLHVAMLFAAEPKAQQVLFDLHPIAFTGGVDSTVHTNTIIHAPAEVFSS